MPLYMDVHKMDAIDPDELSGAHQLDLEVQARHGARYVNYWFSQDAGRVYCLIDAPTKEAAAAVHRDSHGLMADEIIKVEEGT